MTTTSTAEMKPHKTDAGNGSYGICRVIDAARSPSRDPKRSAPIDENHNMNTTETPAAPSPFRLSQTLLVVWSVLASAAAAFFLVAAIFFATASTRNAPSWEYWTQYGDPKAFIEGTAERLEKGWEVVTLSVSGSKFEPVGVVVLRRPKP